MQSGDSVRFKVLNDAPKTIVVTDKKTGKTDEKKVLDVVDKLTGVTFTLWLSSKSLKMEFFKLYKKLGTLKDVNISILLREYEHEQYGTVIGYTVQEDKI